jgi:quercetin dioxygenase-like cupin family protein
MKKTSWLLPGCTAALLLPLESVATEAAPTGVMLAPEQMTWEDNPRVPGLGLAKILGDPQESGAYVQRVRFPKGRIVQAHSHPDDRTYTVLSGTWHVGWGDTYDAAMMKALPPGSFYTEPAGVPHFIATPEGDAIVQITGMGPTTVDDVDPAHAPKK